VKPGDAAAQCPEEPAVLTAGTCQHIEGAPHRDPQITATLFRFGL
ncbi:hypothetical protein scyTo_0024547, partial [Scyliorhinus torazame]|nr:hypothetical protein [Scyliorhinus torazame]